MDTFLKELKGAYLTRALQYLMKIVQFDVLCEC